MFEKTLSDLVKGIRSNKRREAEFVSKCIAEIKVCPHPYKSHRLPASQLGAALFLGASVSGTLSFRLQADDILPARLFLLLHCSPGCNWSCVREVRSALEAQCARFRVQLSPTHRL